MFFYVYERFDPNSLCADRVTVQSHSQDLSYRQVCHLFFFNTFLSTYLQLILPQ
jgi:hypothetical protein